MGVEQLALVNQPTRDRAVHALASVLVEGLPDTVMEWVIGESAGFLCPDGRTSDATAAFLETPDGNAMRDRLQAVVIGDVSKRFDGALVSALASRINEECGSADAAAPLQAVAQAL